MTSLIESCKSRSQRIAGLSYIEKKIKCMTNQRIPSRFPKETLRSIREVTQPNVYMVYVKYLYRPFVAYGLKQSKNTNSYFLEELEPLFQTVFILLKKI